VSADTEGSATVSADTEEMQKHSPTSSAEACFCTPAWLLAGYFPKASLQLDPSCGPPAQQGGPRPRVYVYDLPTHFNCPSSLAPPPGPPFTYTLGLCLPVSCISPLAAHRILPRHPYNWTQAVPSTARGPGPRVSVYDLPTYFNT